MKPRVLIVAPDDGKTATYISEAFVQNEWMAEIFDYRKIAQRQDLQMMNALFCDTCLSRDLVLILKGELISDQALRMVTPKVPTALWHFDSWQAKESFIIERAKLVRYFFTIAKGLVPWYREQGINAYWLSEACSPEHHGFYYNENRTQYGGKRYRSDVSFIGTIENVGDRADWLIKVKQRFPKLMVWGSLPDPRIKECHLGRAEPDARHAEICYRTKVNLDRSRTPDIEGSWSARIYRVMAAGGFLLANNVKGVQEYFKVPDEFAVYDSKDYNDCLDKIAKYLGDDEARLKIAERGRFRALTFETFKDRIKVMIKVMKL